MPTFTPRPTADTFTWTHVIYSVHRSYAMVGVGGGGRSHAWSHDRADLAPLHHLTLP